MRLTTLFNTPKLFEMDWYDKSPITAVLNRNRGRWIHFSQGAPNRDYRNATLLPEPTKPDSYNPKAMKQYQHDLQVVARKNALQKVPKIGVNPKSMWQDPKGVYFYPVDWALSGAERIRIGQQYAFNFPFYYIAEIKLNDTNGIDLSRITWDQVTALAQRNGWLDQMEAFQALSPEDQKTQLGYQTDATRPGSFLWNFVSQRSKQDKMRWNQAFRGVSFIRDPNQGIIHSNEPDQVLVLDPRVMKIVDFGENKRPIAPTSQDGDDWYLALMNVIKAVRGEMGGDLTWNKKRPSLQFVYGNASFTLRLPEKTKDIGLRLNFTYGRAVGSLSIDYKELNALSSEQIVKRITDKARQVGSRKTDLMFQPIISIEESKRLMIRNFTNNLGLSIKTVISNPESPSEARYAQVNLTGTSNRVVDRIAIETKITLTLNKGDLDGGCNVWVGKHHILSASSPYGEDYRDADSMFDSLLPVIDRNLEHMISDFSPSEKNSGYRRHPRFGYQEQVPAFRGWLAQNSGLNLNGKIQQHFEQDIASFEAYPDQRVLLSDIAYVMNSKY